MFPVSAEHALGIDALLDAVMVRLPRHRPNPRSSDRASSDERHPAHHLGRPNVGKSTLVNAPSARSGRLAEPMPGTTRDPIDTDLVHDGRRYVLTDTAGIRKSVRLPRRLRR